MNNKLTGNFISQRRRELSLNQKQLAEKLNVTDKAVSKWETGRSAPDISMLEPLAEALEVSVVEILKGEKIEKEKLVPVSDEVIVKTMKKGERDNRTAMIVGACIMFFTVLFCIVSYLGYHYFRSIPIDDARIIDTVSEEPFYAAYTGKAEIVKRDKKGDYYFYLLKFDNGVAFSLFDRDKIFKDRIVYSGGASEKEENRIQLYTLGEKNHTVNAFFGYGMTDETYSYRYRGVKCTRQIEGEYILDVLIDLDDSFSVASIIYSD